MTDINMQRVCGGRLTEGDFWSYNQKFDGDLESTPKTITKDSTTELRKLDVLGQMV